MIGVVLDAVDGMPVGLPLVVSNLAGAVQSLRTMLELDFMRQAFLAGTALSLVAGLVGYLVVLRRLIFTSDFLSHVAFPGALGAILLGISPLLGVFGLSASVALGLSALGERARARDVTTGTALAWVFGVGALLLSLYTSGSSARNSTVGVNVLFGSIFGLQTRQAQLVALVGALVVVVLLVVARPLLFASLDPDVAAARGVPVRLLNAVFLILLAVTTAEAVQAVGALLIFALLITPAAIARRLTVRPYAAWLLSGLLAIGFTWAGLVLAYELPYPVSFFITGLAFAGYVAVVAVQWVATLRRPAGRTAPGPAG